MHTDGQFVVCRPPKPRDGTEGATEGSERRFLGAVATVY